MFSITVDWTFYLHPCCCIEPHRIYRYQTPKPYHVLKLRVSTGTHPSSGNECVAPFDFTNGYMKLPCLSVCLSVWHKIDSTCVYPGTWELMQAFMHFTSLMFCIHIEVLYTWWIVPWMSVLLSVVVKRGNVPHSPTVYVLGTTTRTVRAPTRSHSVPAKVPSRTTQLHF